MRILHLDLEGFGPFRDRQQLDFARAAESGILLITGRTGAGKSSLLDAVSFALYGAVPRYDGQVGRVRSDHLAPDAVTRVTLEFEIGTERFRIERQPEWSRPKKRGTGTTLQKQEAALWRWDESAQEWEGLASRPVDVAAELRTVLTLTHEQFLQVVLLAQGGFQRFLQAGDQERQDTLRTLFRTQRFAEVEEFLAERRKALEAMDGQREARILGLLEQSEEALARTLAIDAEDADDAQVSDEGGLASDAAAAPGAVGILERRDAVAAAVATLAAAAERAAADAAAAEQKRTSADRIARETRALADAQRRRAVAHEQQRELAAAAPSIAALRTELAAAELAAGVAETQDQLRAARESAALEAKRLALAGAELARARDAAAGPGTEQAQVQATEQDPAPALTHTCEPAVDAARAAVLSSDALRTEREQTSETLVLLREAVLDEERRRKLEAARAAASAAVAAAEAAASAAQDRASVLPGLREAAQTAFQDASLRAAALPERQRELERARTQLAAAREAADLRPRVDAAVVASARLAAAHSAAATEVSTLLARRLAGMAGELAETLVAGEACVVCGATEHPNPAVREDAVAQEDIEAAEAAQANAQREFETARAAEQRLAAELVAATTTSAAQDIETAQVAESAAVAAERDAAAAASQLAELQRAVDTLVEEAQRSAAEEIERRELIASRGSERDALASQLRDLDAELERARAGFDAVSDRVRAVTAHQGAVDAALDALSAHDSAESRVTELVSAVATARAEAGFLDAAAVDAATRDTSTHEDLAARILAHNTAVHRNEGVLAAPELQGLPAEPAPLDEREAALAAATTAAREAAALAVTLAGIRSEREGQLQRLDAEIAAGAESAAELMRLRLLADTLQGKDPNTRRMRLEVFVLAARLEAIVESANARLARMVGGRYRLQHDDGPRSRGRQSGLGLAVLDEYTGRTRSTASLSGGETFLVSLSLALGLADVVTAESGGVRLDTLFIDEGFGTLDPDALDQALATLDALREGGRTVALISHVAELRERLPAQLEVVVDPRGVSRLRGDGVTETPPTMKETPDT